MLERALCAVLLALAGNALAAGELRTLFHTPEERERLDRLRRGEAQEPSAAAPRRGPPVVTGFVKRSDDRNTVWIDGRPVTLSGSKSAPYTDPGKVGRDAAQPIEIKPSR